jgi:hypothetical protein
VTKNMDNHLHVPAGAPAWVDEELIDSTIELFGPRYDGGLTEEQALEIILTITKALPEYEPWRMS